MLLWWRSTFKLQML